MLFAKDLLNSPKERVGFVLDDSTIIEVENICADPEEGFEVRGEDLLRYIDDAVATWHTHPGETSNLSYGDHHSFLNYPDLLHHIIGTDGVTTYAVRNGKVIREGSSLWPSEDVT